MDNTDKSLQDARNAWTAREAAWRVMPEKYDDTWTHVMCLSREHGNVSYYLPLEDYQEAFMPLTRSLWANGYTFVITPM